MKRILMLGLSLAFLVCLVSAPASAEEQKQEKFTQGSFSIELVRDVLRIGYLLPPDAAEEEFARLLARLGIFPCDNKWDVKKDMTPDDICCVIGEQPGCVSVGDASSLREKLFNRFPELFWIGIEPVQPVSPFAP